jgi:hypothetical protein
MKTPAGRCLTGALLLAAGLLTGCTTPDTYPKSAVYGALALPHDARALGLTMTRPGAEFTVLPPDSKNDAAWSQAAAGLRDSAAEPLVAPFAFVMGGIIGGVLGVSESELNAATGSIEAAAQAAHLADRLAQTFTGRINTDQPGRIRRLADNLPLEPGIEQGQLQRGSVAGSVVWRRRPQAAHPLARTEIDTLIGLRVMFQGFQSRTNPNVNSTGDMEKTNPPLAFVLIVDASAVRTRDWATLGGLTLTYESMPRKFTEWAAGGAQPLRQEMDAGFQFILSQLTAGIVPEVPRA